MLELELGAGGDCSPACDAWVARWAAWFATRFVEAPPAMIVELDPDRYLTLIGTKSRNMLRKADAAGLTFGGFDWNERLDELYAINTSKPIRSGRPMRPSYLQRPQPRSSSSTCSAHRSVYLGGFDDAGELRAYVVLALAGELAIVNTILGHGDYLTLGIMNGLVREIVRAARETDRVTAINYLSLTGPHGLVRFKRSVGFVETVTRLK